MLHDELCCPGARETVPKAELTAVLSTFLGGRPRLSSHANLSARFDAAWDGLVCSVELIVVTTELRDVGA